MSDKEITEAERELARSVGLDPQPSPIPNNGLPSAHDLVCEAMIGSFYGDSPQQNEDQVVETVYADLLESFMSLCGGRSNAIAEIKRRKEFGQLKYGTPLQPYNGRDAVVDAKEEMGDALVYLACKVFQNRFPNEGAEPPTLQA
ncbi:hypothetical protein SEA_SCENTAE_65 [Gordonia phage SCentae]|nr:hypothetical protein SEA_SCENTAE_65 [Gordonia phage SCentae]